MKNTILVLALFIGVSFIASAQAPLKMNYQAVARSASGDPITNQNITLRLSILGGSVSGSPQYVESHAVTTNQFGLFSVQLGTGVILGGNLGLIAWSSNQYFLRVEMDATGGSSFVALGTPTQLVSVPYALEAQHAASAETVTGSVIVAGDIMGTTSNATVTRLQNKPISTINPILGQVLKWNGTEWQAANDQDLDNQQLSIMGNTLSLSNGGSVILPIYSDTQTLTISGNQLSIANGNTVTLPSTGPTYTAGSGISLSGNTITNNGDLSNTNEIQSISISGNLISLSNGGGSITLPPNSGTDNQTLSLSGASLSISNGNSVNLPDVSTTNEIQTLSLAGNNLSLSSGGGSVTLPTGTTYTAGTGISLAGNAVTNTGDLSTTNEIQMLSLAGNNLSLSAGGGSVTLPTGTTYTAGTGISLAGNAVTNTGDLSTTNEIQTLSLAGNNLSLSSGGGSVTLPTGTTYSAGTGISLVGNAVTNTGDLSNSNEIQMLSLAGNNLSLSSGGGSVTLPTGTTYSAGTGIKHCREYGDKHGRYESS